jgi:predicted HicB family RNase H-like nuclease
MNYKGYEAVVGLDEDAKLLHGEVINTRDVITFQGTTVSELETAFRDSIEEYLALCEERGEEPEKPFSGKFVVRVDPSIHKRLALYAKKQHKSLNSFVSEALSASLENRPARKSSR